MTIFISGGAKNGKSSLAQQLTLALADGGVHYYVATMIPVDEEDRERIRRHIADRAGLGFETIEIGTDILSCLKYGSPDGAYLVDSATALLQNAMFPADKGYRMDIDAAKRCADDLISFAVQVKNAVFVSDYIYSDSNHYDAATEQYRNCLAEIDRRLAKACDTVIEVCAGRKIIYKGELPL